MPKPSPTPVPRNLASLTIISEETKLALAKLHPTYELALETKESQARFGSRLKQLRSNWKFATLIQWCGFFSAIIKMASENIEIDVIEEELMGIQQPPTLIDKLRVNLLYAMTGSKNIKVETFNANARKFYKSVVSYDPSISNPFGTDEDSTNWEDFSDAEKVDTLHFFTTYLSQTEYFRSLIDDLPTEHQEYRVEPIGWSDFTDKDDNGAYYLLDDNRLYLKVEHFPSSEIKEELESKVLKKKRKNKYYSGGNKKRRRRGTRLFTKADSEELEKKEEEPEETSIADESSESTNLEKDPWNIEPVSITWNCVCASIFDWEIFLTALKKKQANSTYNKQLYRFLTTQVVPEIEEAEVNRRKNSVHREKERNKSFLLVNRKRSSRLEEKMKQREEEEKLKKEKEEKEKEERRERIRLKKMEETKKKVEKGLVVKGIAEDVQKEIHKKLRAEREIARQKRLSELHAASPAAEIKDESELKENASKPQTVINGSISHSSSLSPNQNKTSTIQNPNSMFQPHTNQLQSVPQSFLTLPNADQSQVSIPSISNLIPQKHEQPQLPHIQGFRNERSDNVQNISLPPPLTANNNTIPQKHQIPSNISQHMYQQQPPVNGQSNQQPFLYQQQSSQSLPFPQYQQTHSQLPLHLSNLGSMNGTNGIQAYKSYVSSPQSHSNSPPNRRPSISGGIPGPYTQPFTSNGNSQLQPSPSQLPQIGLGQFHQNPPQNFSQETNGYINQISGPSFESTTQQTLPLPPNSFPSPQGQNLNGNNSNNGFGYNQYGSIGQGTIGRR